MIGAILLDGNAVFDVMPILHPADFFRDENRWCYEAAIAIADRSEEVTPWTVQHEIERAGHLDEIGGEPYFADLIAETFTAVGVEAHARIVARDATYRRTIEAAGQIAKLAYQGGPDAEAVLAEAQRLISAVESPVSVGTVVSAAELIESLENAVEAAHVTSGYRAIDRITGGLTNGQMTLIGARTDRGKTALMACMCWRSAVEGVPSLYIPLEGSREEIAHRMAAAAYGISQSYARNRGWGDYSPEGYRAAWKRLAELPIYWPDAGRTPRTVDQIVAAAALAQRRYGIRVVYLDHIDALPIEREHRNQSDASVMAMVMRELQGLVARTGLHVVTGSQVNREADNDRDRDGAPLTVPRMTRLKESSSKEQAHQTVLMVELADDDKAKPIRFLNAYVEKVKGDPNGRWIQAPIRGEWWPSLYMDARSGAIREQGETPIQPVQMEAEPWL